MNELKGGKGEVNVLEKGEHADQATMIYPTLPLGSVIVLSPTTVDTVLDPGSWLMAWNIAPTESQTRTPKHSIHMCGNMLNMPSWKPASRHYQSWQTEVSNPGWLTANKEGSDICPYAMLKIDLPCLGSEIQAVKHVGTC